MSLTVDGHRRSRVGLRPFLSGPEERCQTQLRFLSGVEVPGNTLVYSGVKVGVTLTEEGDWLWGKGKRRSYGG